MYEVIGTTTKKSYGIFSTCRDAEAWIKNHRAELAEEGFRIFPW